MRIEDLSTPALVVDLGVLERNITRMQRFSTEHGIGLRPHIKTHKTVEIARMQLEAGSLGLTVAKVGEAEALRPVRAKHVLVAHPIFGVAKLDRLAALAVDTDVVVAVDHPATALAISNAAMRRGCEIGIVVEFDAGSRRCGVKAGPECAELGKIIQGMAGVRLRGLMTYFGSVWGDAAFREEEAKRAAVDVRTAVAAFRAKGLPLEIVSGGATPAVEFTSLFEDLTEIRPGTYVFNDLNTYHQGLCRLEDCAAFVLTTVVSTAVEGRAILDAGSKTFASDQLSAGPKQGFGHVIGRPELTLSRLNEEHGYLETGDSRELKVGDLLRVIPNHICPAVNLHDELFLMRDGEVVGSWRVAARGKIR